MGFEINICLYHRTALNGCPNTSLEDLFAFTCGMNQVVKLKK